MMKRFFLFFPVALASAVLATVSFAQPAVRQAPSEEVTVIAPYYVHQKELKNDIRSPVLAVSIEKRVSYADLDLSKPADADKFRSRISEAAVTLCKQLELLYPSGAYVPVSHQDCPKSATDQAMFAAKLIIDFWRM